ncbi:sigma-70 family RNA polymerase sigma factor [Natronosporangium hydrolyticum]|uniref:RNA polymerase sigma factor n=1 Tax=Natronosporangium hydrolyticum TaxID=2811111 RepID=A0A895YA96_9ACTN|nr:sigma-70 family RNA polymerase sigma factor [Natronosporangium hydrolyticum]QSB14694.1 sigma-70 family RNA polymerase sigma factor [Natronosporangium hydrolyticum]
MAADEVTITNLALAAKAGDQAAAAAFVRATQQQVHRFLAHLVHPREAEDLAQETYLRAMKALPRFAARSSARTWLYSIARRVAADHLRAAAARPRRAEVADVDAAVDAVVTSPRFEEQVALRELLAGLTEERRLAFIATQVLGLSYAEAAEVCDCPIGTVRSRVARAREDLVVAMQGHGSRPGRGSGAAGGLAG